MTLTHTESFFKNTALFYYSFNDDAFSGATNEIRYYDTKAGIDIT